MAILGKRKSRQDDGAPVVSKLDAAEIFRRHFEAQFKPLDEDGREEDVTLPQREQDDDNDDDDDWAVNRKRNEDEYDGNDSDSWVGLSDDEDGVDDDEEEFNGAVSIVEVIDHSKPQVPKDAKMSKKELKAFMSSKVIDHTVPNPSCTDVSSSSKSTKVLPEDAPSLLAQDLELRRLLAESHLLTPSHNNAASASVFAASVVHGTSGAAEPRTFAAGRTRQKATDLRLQALGSKTSLLKQEKMPMHMRKGIVASASAKEARRRREAKENGVILERSAQGKKKSSGRGGKNERGVDGPGIGRFKGAELRISESDVRKIEGSRDTFGRRERGGRGRRR